MGLLRFWRRDPPSPSVPQRSLPSGITRWLAPARYFTRAEAEHHADLTGRFISQVRWEAARGFDVTRDMQVAVAAHAALLVMEFDDGLASYADVTSVIMHPTTIVKRGAHYVGDGMWSDDDDPIIGEAVHKGPVLVSWDAAAQQAREPWRGESVLLHEFAHRLDMLDGVSDGTPLLATEHELAEWVRVCTVSLQRLRAHEEPSVLRSYATTNPAEFFAVATEVFFTRPHELRDENPDLYLVLSTYFRQDPAARRPV